MRETLAAADLIPGDFTIPNGYEVINYPRSGVEGRSAIDFLEGEIVITRHIHSETPLEIIRF